MFDHLLPKLGFNATSAKFSEASDDGRCPKCGGSEFKATKKKRKGLVGRKKFVTCQLCNFRMKRG